MILSDICDYVTAKICSDSISLEQYVTTENLLPNKAGMTMAANLPPNTCQLTYFLPGDILVSNIRPYLKKIWVATIEGGASADVLVFRAIRPELQLYVQSLLMQDSFFDHIMKAPKGLRMPRGDKNHIMRFPVVDVGSKERIGKILSDIDRKIALNRQTCATLETMAKQLYDYWFVQFDFPDENGLPYKSSGNPMTYNPTLKREIPQGWEVIRIEQLIKERKNGDWGNAEHKAGHIKVGCIRGADIVELCNLPQRYISSQHTNRLLSPGDIVVEISGGSPTQSTGRTAFISEGVLQRNGENVVCSNFCQTITPSEATYSEYLYYFLNLLYDNGHMFNFEGKTSGLKNLQIESLLSTSWYKPTAKLLEGFHHSIQLLYKKRDNCINENLHLTSLRDFLLPLLMNGQATIKD